MDVNPQNCLEEENYEEVVVRREPMVVEPYNEFIKEEKEE
jgi:heat shock protein HspQ